MYFLPLGTKGEGKESYSYDCCFLSSIQGDFDVKEAYFRVTYSGFLQEEGWEDEQWAGGWTDKWKKG